MEGSLGESLPNSVSPQRLRPLVRLWSSATPYLYLAPAGLVLLVFFFYPVIYTLYISLHRWNLVGTNVSYLGLKNYERMLQSSEFWNALSNTGIYITVVGGASIVLGLLVALLINRLRRGKSLWRTAYFVPYAATLVGMAYVWSWLYHPSFGLINTVLKSIGLTPYGWLNDRSTAMLSIIIIGVWQTIGYNMVLFLAGLSNIPHSHYEAAEIDGAGALQRFWHVTLPALSPTTFLVLITTSIVLFQVFDQVQVLTKGGPAGSTEVIAFLLWREAFEFFRAGYAAALAYVMFAVILALTLLQNLLMGKKVHYQ